jgi:hypothetical protein
MHYGSRNTLQVKFIRTRVPPGTKRSCISDPKSLSWGEREREKSASEGEYDGSNKPALYFPLIVYWEIQLFLHQLSSLPPLNRTSVAQTTNASATSRIMTLTPAFDRLVLVGLLKRVQQCMRQRGEGGACAGQVRCAEGGEPQDRGERSRHCRPRPSPQLNAPGRVGPGRAEASRPCARVWGGSPHDASSSPLPGVNTVRKEMCEDRHKHTPPWFYLTKVASVWTDSHIEFPIVR